MSIPSNLIPRRIPELPPIPAGADSGIVPIVYNGVLYQGDIRTIVNNVQVPGSRLVGTTAPLQGGGNLQQDLNLSLMPNGVTDIFLSPTGVTSGNYGSSSSTVQLSVNDRGRITAVSASPISLENNLALTVPAIGSPGGNIGTSLLAARADHQHPAVNLSDANQTVSPLRLDRGGFGTAMPATVTDPVRLTSEGYLPYHAADQTQFAYIQDPPPSLTPLNPSTLVLTCLEGGTPRWLQAGTGAGTIASLTVTMPAEFNTQPAVGSTNSVLNFTWRDQSSNLGYFLATPVAAPETGATIPSLRRIAVADLPSVGTPLDAAGSAANTWQLTTNVQGNVVLATQVPIQIGRGQITATGSWNAAVAADWTTAVNITGGSALGLTNLTATNASFTNLNVTSLPGGNRVLTSTGTTVNSVSVLPLNLGGTSLVAPSGYLRFDPGNVVTQLSVIPVNDLSAKGIQIGDTGINLGQVVDSLSNVASITVTGAVTLDNQLVTKAYVDSLVQGLDVKASCKVATVANLAALSGTPIVDGYQTAVGDRILVKNQTTATQNGIYDVSAGTWSRSSDANIYAELVGAFVFIENHGGTTSSTGWAAAIPPTGTLGTTNIVFAQFSGAGTYTAGTGLTLTGTQFSLSNTAVTPGNYGNASNSVTLSVNAQGQLTSIVNTPIAISTAQITSGTLPNSLFSSATVYSNITQFGNIASGTWGGGVIGRGFGGTGIASPAGYLKFNGSSPPNQNALIPNTDISGLGTLSTQNASAVALTGGSITGVAIGTAVIRAGAFLNALDVSAGVTIADTTANPIVNASGSGTGYVIDANNRTSTDSNTNAKAGRLGRLDFLSNALKTTPTSGTIEYDGSNLWFSTLIDGSLQRVNLSVFEKAGNSLTYGFIVS